MKNRRGVPTAKNLRVRRAELDLTQRDVAKRAGISRHRYWDLENGFQTPTDVELDRLARALKTSADRLQQSSSMSVTT